MDVDNSELVILSEDEVISETDCNFVIFSMNKSISWEFSPVNRNMVSVYAIYLTI